MVEAAVAAGVTRMVGMGIDLNHSRHALELAHEFPQVFAGVGH